MTEIQNAESGEIEQILANLDKKWEAAREAGLPSPELTKEESAALDADWGQSVTRHMPEKEEEWTEKGYCFSWIDLKPDYIHPTDWELFARLPEPKIPCKRIIRFSLLGGGQIRFTEHLGYFEHSKAEGDFIHRLRNEIKVIAHVGDNIVTASGRTDGVVYEMCAEAVLLRGKHQDIADRVAATFRIMDKDPEKFFALLDGSEGCGICGKPLRDEISKLIAVGPCCAKKYGRPYSREAAEQRLALRRKLLGEA